MRRSYISPEFQNNNVYGTYNMLEQSNYFGSKMLEIEDSINISNQNVIYYQKTNGEQIDFDTETTLESVIYSSANDKLSNHTLTLDQRQSQYNLDNSTNWIMNINLNAILSNYIYAQLKKYRTFEGFKNEMNIYNDVNVAMKKYIDLNVLNRYKYKSLELYVKYNDMRSQNLLRYKNTWNENLIKPEYRLTKFQSATDYNQNNVIIEFNQSEPSKTYNFDYFFNVIFDKI